MFMSKKETQGEMFNIPFIVAVERKSCLAGMVRNTLMIMGFFPP